MSYQAVQTLTIQQQAVVPRLAVKQLRRSRKRMSHLLPPILLFSTLLLQLTIRIEIIEHGYEVERLRAIALQKDAQLRQLRLDLAYATRPKLLSESATKRLELGLLSPERVREIPEATR